MVQAKHIDIQQGRKTLSSLLLCFLALLLSACYKEEIPEVVERVRVGDSLPRFELLMNNGLRLSWQDFQDKTVVLVFFSTQCGDCRKELPVVESLWQANQGRPDLMVLAISRGEGEEMVGPFWREMNLSLPYSAQNDRRIYELFASSVVPRIYIANPEGTVIAAFDHSNMPNLQTLMQIVGTPRLQ